MANQTKWILEDLLPMASECNPMPSACNPMAEDLLLQISIEQERRVLTRYRRSSRSQRLLVGRVVEEPDLNSTTPQQRHGWCRPPARWRSLLYSNGRNCWGTGSVDLGKAMTGKRRDGRRGTAAGSTATRGSGGEGGWRTVDAMAGGRADGNGGGGGGGASSARRKP